MTSHPPSHNEPELEAALTRALESRPRIAIPHDFALRVASHLPSRPAMYHLAALSESTSRPRFGRRAAFAAFALLLAIFVVLAAVSGRITASGYLALTAVEWIFAAEFILLTAWLSLRPRSVF